MAAISGIRGALRPFAEAGYSRLAMGIGPHANLANFGLGADVWSAAHLGWRAGFHVWLQPGFNQNGLPVPAMQIYAFEVDLLLR